MLTALKRRFRFVLDPSFSNFDGIYVASTLLNPGYRSLLDSSQLHEAKKFVKDMMVCNHIGLELEGDSHQSNDSSVLDKELEDEEPPCKRFKGLSRVCKLLAEQEEEINNVFLTEEEEEIEKYMQSKPSKEEILWDPIEYWIKFEKFYPLLSPIACQIITTTASTAAIERVFSVSGEATKGKRNRLVDYNLERETLLRMYI